MSVSSQSSNSSNCEQGGDHLVCPGPSTPIQTSLDCSAVICSSGCMIRACGQAPYEGATKRGPGKQPTNNKFYKTKKLTHGRCALKKPPNHKHKLIGCRWYFPPHALQTLY